MELSKLKPTSLDKFILNELKAPFFFGIMVFTIILTAGGLLFKIANLIIERGVSFGIVIRLFLYYLPRLVSFTIPMSCLLAALLGFGKLSANSEIVALKSAGLSFQRIARPVVIASVIVSVLAFFVNETVVPVSERAAANVMMYEVFQRTPPVFKDKIFLREGDGSNLKRVIYINRMNIKTGDMQEIVVEEFEKGRLSRIISAARAKWVDGSWWILDGRVYDIREDGDVELLFKFTKQALTLEFNPAEIAKQGRLDPDQMTITELYRTIVLYDKKGLETNEMKMTFHLRIGVPWACLILAVMGAALGSRPQRSSSGVGLGMSAIIVFIYYVIMSFSQALGEAGYVPPVIAAWTANAVFFVVGMLLCKKANNLG
jgi:lipopolysaccharide export system permease protein